MTLSAGTRLGPYEILAPIGAGGMGEVYRAADPRIGREVAIKVLPAAFQQDPERLRRFEVEARSAGVLNHPHILAVYDVGSLDGVPYVVTELLAGETLRDRLKLGPLPSRKALELGTQIAEGMAAAHEHGIVHRDLKPENLFLTKDGRLKILDFGLAKLAPAHTGGEVPPGQPTLALDSGPGTVWGTVGYMSPEQVRGSPVDHRSDIFALGAILYEMLSGKRAFQGASPADTMSAILKDDPPDLTEIVGGIPPVLERLVRRCLEKKPGERFQSARDLAFDLSQVSGLSGTQAAQGAKRRHSGIRRFLPAAIVLVILVGAAMLLPRLPGRGHRHVARLTVDLPRQMRLGVNDYAAISPDGSTMVISLEDSSGAASLWLRSLESLTPRRIAGTEGGADPFWSPDGRSIGFFAEGKMKRWSLAGGPPQVICDAGSPRGAAWSKKNVIVFAPGASGGLFTVDAAGGTPAPVTTLDSTLQETAHRYPCFLPDGEHFLFLAIPDRNGLHNVYAGSLGSSRTKRVLQASRAPQYADPGYLLFGRGDQLMAQRFDPRRIEVEGEEVSIAENPGVSTALGLPVAFSSRTGVAVYRSEAVLSTELGWYSMRGELLSKIPIPPRRYAIPRLSPDGTKAVAVGGDGTNSDLWLFDLATGGSARFTSDRSAEAPRWSGDGTRILYNTFGGTMFVIRSVQGDEQEVVYRSSKPFQTIWDWSSDGRYIVFRQISSETGFDIWILPTFGDRKPFPYLTSAAEEQLAAIHPGGRWVAYTSDESGQREIYVQMFPKPGRKRRISAGGGVVPVWSRDGKTLLYLVPGGGRAMSVAVREGETIEMGLPRVLFTWPAEAFRRVRGGDLSSDGRLLLAVDAGEAARVPVVIVNWPELLDRPLPRP